MKNTILYSNHGMSQSAVFWFSNSINASTPPHTNPPPPTSPPPPTTHRPPTTQILIAAAFFFWSECVFLLHSLIRGYVVWGYSDEKKSPFFVVVMPSTALTNTCRKMGASQCLFVFYILAIEKTDFKSLHLFVNNTKTDFWYLCHYYGKMSILDICKNEGSKPLSTPVTSR